MGRITKPVRLDKMILESHHLNHENTFLIDSPADEEKVKHLKDKIENALQDVENIKIMNPQISWSAKNIFKEQNELEENNDEIVLCVAIKIKRNNRKTENYEMEKVQDDNGHPYENNVNNNNFDFKVNNE